MSSQFKYTFSVIIPTYNRAYTLGRALASLERQSFRDFEVIVIDDGSTDDTEHLVKSWSSKVDFPVQYVRQPNRGKPAAHNKGVELAQGFFSVILDSDDALTDDSLAIMKTRWDSIAEQEKGSFAGVEGICADFEHKVVGERFPQDIIDSDHITLRRHYRIKGPIKGAIRTDVFREYPFPIIEGEKFILESVVWKRMAHKYKIRYVNDILQLIEHQEDGLTANRFWSRINNPRGYRLSFLEDINFHTEEKSFFRIFRNYVKYARFSFHAKVAMTQQAREIKSPGLWALALPAGWLNWIRDKVKQRTTKSVADR